MSSSRESARVANAQQTLDTLYDISQLLNTGLDRETLATCVSMIENGVNPEALATVIKELRREAVGKFVLFLFLHSYGSVAVDDVWVPYAVQEGEPVAARRQPRDTHHSEIAVLNGVWPTSTCSLNLPGSPIEHAASFSHPDTEFITPYLVHPAVPNNPWPDQLVVDGKSPGNSKKAAAKIIKDEIEIAEANADGNSIHSYSDAHAGTLHSIPKVGLGYTVKYGRKTLANGSTSIGPRANIYDAEMLGIAL
ncbi:unnamed protein product [Rhizoctonia solani]|nr:unnamed protein product [Rhizoctonia solani]